MCGESLTATVGILRINDQIRLAMRDVVKSTRSVIVVRCQSCQRRGIIAEHELLRFGLKPGAPIAQFVKRLRCRKCAAAACWRDDLNQEVRLRDDPRCFLSFTVSA